MKEEDHSSIFERAAHRPSNKKKTAAQPPAQKPAEDKEAKALGHVKNEDAPELFQKIQNIHKEIELKLESIYERSDLSPQKLDAYLAMFSESGYSLSELKAMHKEQKKLEDKIAKVLGVGTEKTHQEHVQDKATKDRHAKSLGARKQWIPMR